MKVLLVSPNREHLPDPVFPLGLAYVASSLMKEGHDIKVLDLCFSENVEENIKMSIRDFQPDIIGISIRNIDDVAYPRRYFYLSEYKNAVTILRRLSGAPIVLGGSGFTIMPEKFMDALNADYGIVGEGEDTFPKFLRAIRSGNIKREGSLLFGPLRLKSLDETTPERGLFDAESYYRYGGMLNVQTKRGCKFSCIYCTYPKIEGKKIRLRSPEKVVNEMEDIVSKTGIRHFFIVDSIFNHPADHASAICREIIKRLLDIKWSCYCSPAGMTPKLIELMLRAGCTGIEFGTDSLNDETLRLLGKGFTSKNVSEVSGLCKEMGLKFCHFIFIGAPSDTLQRVEKNIGRLDGLKPDAAVIMVGIRVFPGTGLAKLAEEDLGIKNIGLEPVFYISPEVLRNIDSIISDVSKRKNWALPGFEMNIYPRLQKKLRESGIKGALWEGLSKRCS